MMTLTRSVLGAGRPDSKSSVLYDAPGPHTRRRHLAVAVGFSVLFVAVAVLVLVILGENDQLSESKWHPFVVGTTWTTYILPGLWGTLKAAVISIVLAFVIGTALGIGRLSDRQAVRVISGTVVELFRAVPVLILMIFTYFAFAMYGLFPSKHLALAAVVTGLTLYNGSVIAEILRSGIRALPAGQAEAAAALGLSGMQTTRIILLPQAVTTMLPALISQMVIALKDSALGYQIGYIEVVRSGVQSASYYRNYFAALIVVAAIMITINVLLTAAASRLERTLRQRRRRTASEPVG